MRRNVHRIAFWSPLIMSALAVMVVLSGADPHAPPGDEGPKAHIFQLLLILQLPIIVTFIATGRPIQWREIFHALSWQMLGWLAAAASLFIVFRGQA